MVNTSQRINLLKQKVDLTKGSLGLGGHKAQVELVLDISCSMRDRYSDGSMQDLVERLGPISLSFDDDGEMPVTVFGRVSHNAGTLNAATAHDYVNRNVINVFNFESSTLYALPLARIVARHWKKSYLYKIGLFDWFADLVSFRNTTEPPVLVLFVTDGDAQDEKDVIRVLNRCKRHPIFVQFIGVGGERTDFQFINKISVNKNVGFLHSSDLVSISDNELYSSLLSKFAEWVKKEQLISKR